MKKGIVLLLILLSLVLLLSGCVGNDDTIQTYVIANESYLVQDDLEAADQPEFLNAGKTVYASIHFIESPQGMEYGVKWYLNDAEIKRETKATQKDLQDIIVYELEAENVVAGTLKLEVSYKDMVLLNKQISIQ
ncbi:MAG TPA: hypothetical protein VJY54_05845 [Lachnospiraceae bacterium]|nr:hypothetical protein [Lachnospiraceae bacterium]